MGYRILLIESEPETGHLVKRALEARGYHVCWVKDGSTGIKTAQEGNLDLILLAADLPDLDGFEVVHSLRVSPQENLVYVPLVMMTENNFQGDSEKVLAAGCDLILAKPINIRELWSRVEGFLAESG